MVRGAGAAAKDEGGTEANPAGEPAGDTGTAGAPPAASETPAAVTDTAPAILELFEVDLGWEFPAEGVASSATLTVGEGHKAHHGTGRSVYAASKAAAIRIVEGPAEYVPVGAKLVRATVYRCEMPERSPVAMMYALLNHEIEPVRRALVYGDLPLPFVRPT